MYFLTFKKLSWHISTPHNFKFPNRNHLHLDWNCNQYQICSVQWWKLQCGLRVCDEV